MENDKSFRNGEDKQEEEEEAKMEKFFALIRSFREARNYRRKELMNDSQVMNNSKRMKRVGGDHSSWVPKFEWEDFTKEVEFVRPPLIFPSPCNNKEKDKEEREDSGLDLKLTL